MKILLITVGVLAFFVIVILVIGALLPKRHSASRTAIIHANPTEAFQLISGPQDWRPDLKEHEFYNDGARHMVRETDKHNQTITYEIVRSQSPTGYQRTIADKNLPFGGSWTWRIQARGQGESVVTITEDGEVYNPMFRFVSRFIMGHTKTIDDYLARLAAAAKASSR